MVPRPPGRVPWGLIALIAITTVATAGVALWLVPLYWLVLAVVMLVPELQARPRPASRPHFRIPEPPVEAPPPLVEAASSDAPDAPPVEQPPKPTRAPQSRRGAGRSRRKNAIVEPPVPVEVTFVRVGPGQFVRVEAPTVASNESSESTGTDASIEIEPVNDSGTVPPSPIEDATSSEITEARASDAPAAGAPSDEPCEPCLADAPVNGGPTEVLAEAPAADGPCEPPCADQAHAVVDCAGDDLPQADADEDTPEVECERDSQTTEGALVSDAPAFDVEATVVAPTAVPGRVPAPLVRIARSQPPRYPRQTVRCRPGGRVAPGRGQVTPRPRRLRGPIRGRRVVRSRLPRAPPEFGLIRLA